MRGQVSFDHESKCTRLLSCSIKRFINHDNNKATPIYFYYYYIIRWPYLIILKWLGLGPLGYLLTWYNLFGFSHKMHSTKFMWQRLSVSWDISAVFSGCSSFLHQWNWFHNILVANLLFKTSLSIHNAQSRYLCMYLRWYHTLQVKFYLLV